MLWSVSGVGCICNPVSCIDSEILTFLIKKIIIQSDNASSFSFQELLLFVFNMNTRLHDEKTGFERMDIHRSIERENMIGSSIFISQ